MRKTKLAIALSVFAAPAFAATTNLENPLYAPKTGEVYSKTNAGIMSKTADGSDAHKKIGHDGEREFPIWRLGEEIGVGINDRLSVNGAFGYTIDNDIDREGMHLGRLGLTYRAFDGTATDGWVFDIYADAHLGGVSAMKGEFDIFNKSFKYDNYANGRWGFYAGMRAGKTFGDLTLSAFGEVLQTYGNDNNKIRLGDSIKTAEDLIVAQSINPANFATYYAACQGGNAGACQAVQLIGIAGMDDVLSVKLKSTTEFNAGLRAFYDLKNNWSLGGGFTYKHHADNGVKGVAVQQGNAPANAVANAIAAGLSDMNDGFDEYILSASVAKQLNDSVQLAAYGEYTMDTSHPNSQNGTDAKAEVGVRVNARF
ncbi:MAG: hypothetical protein LBL46_00465 [Rickettsiales bacterium]|nr:hypothetical protein [Rickettsiales bacterium]